MEQQEINERKNNIIKYFQKIDNGAIDESYFNLFTEDVELYFPKYGFTKGKEGIKHFGETLGKQLNSIYHDIENFNFILSDKFIVVEGREGGETINGTKWPDNKISFGKFCNVFEFENDLIKRVHIYVDPDFTSEHIDRIKELS